MNFIISFLIGAAFALLVWLLWELVKWFLGKARKVHHTGIPPYLEGKPKVDFKVPSRNRMRHRLSFCLCG